MLVDSAFWKVYCVVVIEPGFVFGLVFDFTLFGFFEELIRPSDERGGPERARRELEEVP
jgi:hypothetical protein